MTFINTNCNKYRNNCKCLYFYYSFYYGSNKIQGKMNIFGMTILHCGAVVGKLISQTINFVVSLHSCDIVID